MDGRVRDRVADWSERRVEGLDGLRQLAADGVSGIVESSSSDCWFAMYKGTVLGVHGGRIEDFEGSTAVVRTAPEPDVALLLAMLAAGGEREDRYYTEDTPVSTAHQTLSGGGFAGYLELSENVLSGDYYVAYYGDHSAPVAFVGNSERLVTGQEALERADDEVGIYHVYSVDLDVVELPGSRSESESESESGSRPGTRRSDTAVATGRPNDGGREPADRTGGVPPSRQTEVGSHDRDRDRDAGPESDAGVTDPRPERGDDPGRDGESTARDRPSERESEQTGPEYGSSTSYGDRIGGDRDAGRSVQTPEREEPTRERREDPSDAGDDRNHGGSDSDSGTDTGTGPGTGGRDRPQSPADDRTAGDSDGRAPDSRETTTAGDDTLDGRGGDEDGTLDGRVEEHERRIADLVDRVERLEEAGDAAREERTALRAELEAIDEELSDLRRTVVRLDRAVERVEDSEGESPPVTETGTSGERPSDASGGSGTEPGPSGDTQGGHDEGRDSGGGRDTETGAASVGAEASRDLTPAEALDETTLLLRYGSRGAATLESAHDDDEVDRAAVEDNLRVDVHTPFDDQTTTVEGRPYREFVEDRIEYRFFEWLVRDLLFEIRETGNQATLRDLYDALPTVDRAELRSTVAVDGSDDDDDREGEGDGERESETMTFDVVVRDARERPLVVARINASRDPATEEMVVELRDDANAVGEDQDLAAAFSVTESYFSGTARGAAEEATADSILSRNAKRSYVKLSRKRGYHLCLVAVGSDGEFHLRVPEL